MEEQRKVRVTLPGGVIKEGIEIGVIDSNERWNEVVLADGTTLRIKLALTQVSKFQNAERWMIMKDETVALTNQQTPPRRIL